MTTLATRRGYRRKVNRSLCRKKTVRKCRKVKGCKNTKKTAKKSRYCRKRHNKRLKGGKSTHPGCIDNCLNAEKIPKTPENIENCRKSKWCTFSEHNANLFGVSLNLPQVK